MLGNFAMDSIETKNISRKFGEHKTVILTQSVVLTEFSIKNCFIHAGWWSHNKNWDQSAYTYINKPNYKL